MLSDIIYCKNNIGQWQYLSRDNPYQLYFWEPVVNKLDNQKLKSIYLMNKPIIYEYIVFFHPFN